MALTLNDVYEEFKYREHSYKNEQDRNKFKKTLEAVAKTIVENPTINKQPTTNNQLRGLIQNLSQNLSLNNSVLNHFADLLLNHQNDSNAPTVILAAIEGMKQEIQEYEKNPNAISTTPLIPKQQRIHPYASHTQRTMYSMVGEYIIVCLPGIISAATGNFWPALGAFVGANVIEGIGALIIYKQTGLLRTIGVWAAAHMCPTWMGYAPSNTNTVQPTPSNQTQYGTYANLDKSGVGHPNPNNNLENSNEYEEEENEEQENSDENKETVVTINNNNNNNSKAEEQQFTPGGF